MPDSNFPDTLLGISLLYYGCIEGLVQPIEEIQELKLSNYPEAFAEDTLIIIGREAAEMEKGAANLIKENLGKTVGIEPVIKKDEEILKSDKNSNLILVGTSFSNDLLQEVYTMAVVEEVTSEYPGENKGILQILQNPWNSEKALLMVAGSDKWGVVAALEMLGKPEILDSFIFISELRLPAKSVFSDKYIFLQHHIHKRIEVIEGDYPGPIIDSPTYDFDEKNGRLRGYLSFDINDSLVLVYGSGSSVSGAGGGRENMLHGVYQLPHRSGNLTVLKIDVDGTVYLEYGDNLVILREGEKWENITSEMDVAFSGTAEFTITDWVKNYGFLQKSKIEAR